WRPIVHVQDFCRAFVAVLEAPPDAVHDQVFNVGVNSENYQVADIGRRVAAAVPNSSIEILNKTGGDERSYRVDFSKIARLVPAFKPTWNVDAGIHELYEAFRRCNLTKADFDGSRYFRVRTLRRLIETKA